jgi:hypothetical protein
LSAIRHPYAMGEALRQREIIRRAAMGIETGKFRLL